MLSVEFEPTIPAFERAETVHALDRAAIAIGRFAVYTYEYIRYLQCKQETHNEGVFMSCCTHIQFHKLFIRI
jgi:hypothetical protein